MDTGEGICALDAAQGRALGASAGQMRRGVDLPLGAWLQSPRNVDGEAIDGVATDHVSAKLDAAGALRDIFAAARKTGASVPDLRHGHDEAA